MKRIFSILLLISTLGLNSYAQSETKIWHFGEKAGLDFNFNPPKPLLDGELITNEGCTSVADENGNLLFYSDGITVFNKDHDTMTNGTNLLGNSSSLQSAMAVQKPGSQNIFYLFTTDAVGVNNQGVYYSIIDIDKDEVIVKNKVLISGPGCEMLNGVRHANGLYVWIVGHEGIGDKFFSFLLSPSGLDTAPVETSIGVYYNNRLGSRSALKFSNNNKIAVASENEQLVEMFDFDNLTGKISNKVLIGNTSTLGSTFNPYMVEFSPSNNKLYVSSRSQINVMYQFDLLASNIPQSMVNIMPSDATVGYSKTHCSIQLAIDGKIYVSIYDESYIGVINNPDASGVLADFRWRGVDLRSGKCKQGLPTFLSSYVISSDIKSFNRCFGSLTEFNIVGLDTNFIKSANWNFGDNSTSNILSPTHRYLYEGKYEVSVNLKMIDSSEISIHKDIEIIELPDVTVSSDIYKICKGGYVTLNAGSPDYRYEWSHSVDTFNTQLIEDTGSYSVRVFGECGFIDRNFKITYNSLPDISLKDTTICGNDFVNLKVDDSISYDSLLWMPLNSKSKNITVQEGEYYLTLYHQCATLYDSITVDTLRFDTFNIEIDDPICDYDSVLVNFTVAGYDSIIWLPDNIKGSQFYAKPGLYSLKAFNKCYATTDEFEVIENILPDYNLPDDTMVCNDDELLLVLTDSNVNLKWYEFEVENGMTTISEPGGYSITFTHCDTTIGKYFRVDFREATLFIPNAFTPNNSGLNDVFKPIGQFDDDKKYSLEVFNRWGELLYITTDTQAGWDGTYKGKPAPVGAYLYMISYTNCEDNFQYESGNITLLR